MYFSEIGFALHLPHFISRETGYKKWAANSVLVARLGLNSTAFLLVSFWDYPRTAIFLLAVSLAIYVLDFLIARFVLDPPKIHGGLYYLAHLSLTNFLLDSPGVGIPTVKFTHVLVQVGSLVPVPVLLFTFFTIDKMQRAWDCYDPAYIESLADYKYGICDNGMICNRPQINCAHKATLFDEEIHYLCQLFGVLFALHLAAVPAKIDYYRLTYKNKTH